MPKYKLRTGALVLIARSAVAPAAKKIFNQNTMEVAFYSLGRRSVSVFVIHYTHREEAWPTDALSECRRWFWNLAV